MSNEIEPIGYVAITDLTDRQIAEETLIHLRNLSNLISQLGPMVDMLAQSPMGKSLFGMVMRNG